MRLIFSVTFMIILGNSSTTTTLNDPQTTSSSASSQSPSTTTTGGATSDTSEKGTTETDTTEITSPSSASQPATSSYTMTTTYIENTSDSSTEISTTPSVTSSEMKPNTSPISPESTTNTSSVSPQTSDSTTVSETSETASSTTEEASSSSDSSTTVNKSPVVSSSSTSASSSSDASITVTEASSSSTFLSSNSVTSTVIVTHSPGASSSSDSTSLSSTSVTTNSISTTSERTNMTTEGLTTEETTTEDKFESSTTEEQTSTLSTTLPQTTTSSTSHQTPPVYNIKEEEILYAGDSSITLSINVTFKDCLRGNQVLANIIDEILKLDTCKSVTTESADSCGNNTSYFVIFRVDVDVLASSLLDDEKTKNETIENIATTINSTSAGYVLTTEALAYSSIAACNSKKCRDALVNNKGFSCVNNGSNCTLKSPCLKNGRCSTEHGECYVQAEGNQYLGRCRCKEDDMFTYSGSECKNKAYSWKLWTIIASGVGGGIIVILLFVVVIQCARKKSQPFNQKYGYDSGFDDRENLMHDRRYVTSDEYHRKPIPRDDVGADQVNLQSFENKGYDHWEPLESKETYASMDRHFQDPTFHAQITRPKLTTNKYSTDQLTPF